MKYKRMLSQLPLLAGCMAGGGLAFLVLAGRLTGFWLLSRRPKAFLLCAGSVLIGALLWWALRAAWIRLSAPARPLKWLGLLAAFAAGVLLKIVLPVPAAPVMHVLEIETTGSQPGGQFTLMEMRGPKGQIIPFTDIQVVGGWRRDQDGLTASGDQPASLRYSFYAPSTGKLALLFLEKPEGGRVLLRLNGQEQEISLSSQVVSQRQLELRFQKNSRLDLPLMLADSVALFFVLPVMLFATGLLVSPAVGAFGRFVQRAAGRQSAGRWIFRLDYNVVLITLFLSLSMLPFIGFRGEWSAVNKSIFGYNELYRLYVFIRHDLFQDVVFDQVMIGPGDWMILDNPVSMDDYQNAKPLTDEQLFQLQQRLDSTSAYLRRRGIRFLAAVTPNKNTIYPEYIPAQIPVIGKQSRLDQLITYQKQHGQTQIVEMRAEMLLARKDQMLFYRTDTHWNPYGAYLGYAAIASALQDEFPALKPHPLSDYIYGVDGVRLGDLGSGWVQTSQPETFFQLEPRFERKLARFELLEERHLYSFRYNNDSPENLPTAIIYHDSSMSWIAPFLADHFRKGTFIWSENLDLTYIESEKPDIVIFQCTERFLDNLFALPIVNE